MSDHKTLSPEVEHALRVYVERVVRPLRHDEKEKLKTRRELLAHAEEAYLQERAARGEEAALTATMQRMGEPDSLRDELQLATPLWGRWNWWIDRVIRRRPGEAAWKRPLRAAVFGVVELGTLFAALWVASRFGLFQETPAGREELVRVGFFLTALYALCLFVGVYIAGFVRRALRLKESGSPSGVGEAIGWASLGGALMLVAAVAAFPAAGAPEVLWSWVYFGCCAALAVLFVPGVIALAWLDARDRRGLEEWLELEIE